MKVTVTQHHINIGQRLVPNMCPIALAIRDVCPNWHLITVSPEDVNVFVHRMDCVYISYDLPQKARNFVNSFDQKMPVQPFSFEMWQN